MHSSADIKTAPLVGSKTLTVNFSTNPEKKLAKTFFGPNEYIVCALNITVPSIQGTNHNPKREQRIHIFNLDAKHRVTAAIPADRLAAQLEVITEDLLLAYSQPFKKPAALTLVDMKTGESIPVKTDLLKKDEAYEFIPDKYNVTTISSSSQKNSEQTVWIKYGILGHNVYDQYKESGLMTLAINKTSSGYTGHISSVIPFELNKNFDNSPDPAKCLRYDNCVQFFSTHSGQMYTAEIKNGKLCLQSEKPLKLDNSFTDIHVAPDRTRLFCYYGHTLFDKYQFYYRTPDNKWHEAKPTRQQLASLNTGQPIGWHGDGIQFITTQYGSSLHNSQRLGVFDMVGGQLNHLVSYKPPEYPQPIIITAQGLGVTVVPTDLPACFVNPLMPHRAQLVLSAYKLTEEPEAEAVCAEVQTDLSDQIPYEVIGIISQYIGRFPNSSAFFQPAERDKPTLNKKDQPQTKKLKKN